MTSSHKIKKHDRQMSILLESDGVDGSAGNVFSQLWACRAINIQLERPNIEIVQCQYEFLYYFYCIRYR